jgi:hypothetical protein
MYFWNGFTILESHPEIFVAPILEDIESCWNTFPSGNLITSNTIQRFADDINDICVYEFLRGVCLKVLKNYSNAEWCFSKVITNELKLTDYFYLAPNSVFELAQIRMEQNQPKEAYALLLKARSYQVGQKLETYILIMFRNIHWKTSSISGFTVHWKLWALMDKLGYFGFVNPVI